MVKMAEETPLQEIVNWIAGRPRKEANDFFIKHDPHTGQPLFKVARSSKKDVDEAVLIAQKAQHAWSETPATVRGEFLRRYATCLEEKKKEMAAVVALETGKSPRLALSEVEGCVSQGFFFAGEGQRLYGKTVASGVSDRQVAIVRQPLGVAGLIVPANTPAPNIAWKIFPALICGNSVVLKSAEDAPQTAWLFGQIAQEAGLPEGVLNVVHGLGEEAGAALVEHPAVSIISFTGSTQVGALIAKKCAERFCRVSLELGGKNAFVVAEDADLDQAVRWAILSAFSNAGQRCSAASRIIVLEAVYEKFRQLFLEKARMLKAGPTDQDDLGPLINSKQLDTVLRWVEAAKKSGAKILCGGSRLLDAEHAAGYYVGATVLEGVDPSHEFSCTEVFGPVATLYRVRDLREALIMTNDSPYGLTAAIHTRSLHKAHWFAERAQVGVVSVNAGTYGSEPHMPFGGLKRSGNGTREPGTEALDVYSEWKNIYWNIDPGQI